MLLCKDYILERDPPSCRYILQLAGNDAIIYYPAWQNDKSTHTLFCQLLHKHLFQLNYGQTVPFPQKAIGESSYSVRVLSACNTLDFCSVQVLSTLEKWWENPPPHIVATIQHSAADQTCLFCSDQFCCVNRSEYFQSSAQQCQLILTDSMEGKFSLPLSPPLTYATTINEHFNWSTGGKKAPYRLSKEVPYDSITQNILSLQYFNKALL